MKKIGAIFFIIFTMFATLTFASCGNNKKPDNRLFNQVKEIFVASDLNAWNGFSAKRLDEDGQETLLLNKTQSNLMATSSTNEDMIVNFVLENKDEKVFCQNNIRYYAPKTSNRKYIDESDFDVKTFVNEAFKSNLKELYDYLNDNIGDAISVDIKQEGRFVVYEIKILLNKNGNKILNVVIKKFNNTIIYINLNIEDELDVELSETDEIVTTPDWFDNNDYKTELTYEQAKDYSQNISFEGWEFVKILVPNIFDDYESGREIYISKDYAYSEGVYNGEKDAYNRMFKDNVFYTYYNDGQELHPLEKNEFYRMETSQQTSFLYSLDTFGEISYYSFNMFFNDQNISHYEQYFAAAKKYERDIDVISFRFNTNGIPAPNGVIFDAICSLYYDLDGNLFKAEWYAKQIDTTTTGNDWEEYTICEKMNHIDMPTWFNENDFA